MASIKYDQKKDLRLDALQNATQRIVIEGYRVFGNKAQNVIKEDFKPENVKQTNKQKLKSKWVVNSQNQLILKWFTAEDCQ